MSKLPPKLSRRRFLSQSATALAAGTVAASQLAPLLKAHAATPATEYRSNWSRCADRIWIGQDYWSNPLQDWRIAGGRLECTRAAENRNVHLLVRQLGDNPGSLTMSVRLGRADGALLNQGGGSAGFRIGIQGPLREYRNSLIFGRGIDAGISSEGALFIGALRGARPGTLRLDREEIELRLEAEPSGGAAHQVTLSAHGRDGEELGKISQEIPSDQLTGNLAVVNNFAGSGESLGRFWFDDWTVGGSKVEEHRDRVFGPILFSQYTLSGRVMKMSAQMPPIGPQDSQTVRLQTRQGMRWTTLAEEPIEADSRVAAFRIPNWDDRRDVNYRLAYTLSYRDGRSEEHYWSGTVRRDPANAPSLSVADISCNIHQAFPNELAAANMAKLNPDLLAFVGDQFYEGSGGYGIIREPVDQAMIDVLRKWYMHGWTWRELMRDRPTVSLPDDHDVYQGNIWGEGGADQPISQAAGGYIMAPEWINVINRTQTAHHPDPYDPAPSLRNIIQYYGPLTYGRVSFAILADRHYKSGPEGKVPPTGGRGDHVTDPNFDPRTADVPGVDLLGEKQEQFLEEWAADWRGADMKAVISQTLFTALPTTHGRQPEVLRADYDTNAWPQTPRNRAVRSMRKGFAFHLAGDQHLPAVVHYGVEEHRDGPVAFAGPAVNTGYPRWWEPQLAPWTHPRSETDILGDFTDHFGHPMSVLAVHNGSKDPQGDVLEFLNQKSSGIGIVRFDKRNRKITVECWSLLADPTRRNTQMAGWPVTVDMMDNFARSPTAHLPTLRIRGTANPVVQVFDERDGELVYALRIRGQSFQPHVFAAGRYTVKVGDPDSGRISELKGLEAVSDNRATQDVRV